MSNGTVKKWKKILYEDNGYPDNFTPNECFLAAIEKNKNVRLYTLFECFRGAAEVGKEMSLVVIFWCCYSSLLSQDLSPKTLLLVMGFVLIFGFTFHLWMTEQLTLPSLVYGLKTTLLFSTIGWALSPVLYKLTDSVSTDTVHTTAGASLFLHLITHDYGLPGPLVSKTIALNSAVFSSVCLASRFPTHLAAFSLLCQAVFSFLLSFLARPSLPSPLLVAVILNVVSLSWLAKLPAPTPLIFLTAGIQLLLQVFCPLLFYHFQSAKQTIHGPWDEAVPY